jgi:hypothetical protein
VPKLKILSVIVLSIALSGAVYARGGGGGGRGGGGGGHGGAHFGGGGHGGGHFGGGGHFRGGGAHFSGARGGGARFTSRSAISRSAGRSAFRGNRSLAVRNSAGNLAGRNAAIRSNAVRHTLSSRAVAGALHNRTALHNPGNRALIAATAATAGWHAHNRLGGWWRHGNGGYGWVGPLFWPFAYYDIYDYAFWGYGPSFWGYGYGDIYAGIFAPYGYDDLIGYLPSGGRYYAGGPRESNASLATNATTGELSQMCGEDSREIAGLPIDRVQEAIQPNDEQRKALDDLANASVKAAQSIKAACPTQIALTAPGRIAAMQGRLEAMISAVNMVQPPLDRFYGLLNDEQKARLNALGQEQQQGGRRSGRAARNANTSLAKGCGSEQAGVLQWPDAEIEARVHPTEAQRASLANLKDASAKAAEMLKASCEPDSASALTPPARLAAIGKRLDAMLKAVETVRSALDDLYGELTDEQKAQFEAIGPGRTAPGRAAASPSSSASALASSDESAPSGRHYHRHHHAGIGGIVRRLVSFGW